tara:strand:+ start:907 stop:1956 length:1050 start_codon:yes stop_codon:yes gene_type:complete
MIDESKILIDSDISIANTMPSKFYLNDKYFNRIVDKVFKESWQLITDLKTLDNKLYPYSFLKDTINEPMVLSTDNHGINCLSNVCTHRANILCNESVASNSIKCNYHGRTFSLNGEIISSPGFEGVQNFPNDSDDLKKFKIKKWKNFIFSSIGGQIKIDSILNSISERLKDYPFEKLIFSKKDSKEYTIDAHWALYCENYLEGFHVPFIHKGLNKDVNFNSYKTELIDNGVLQFVDDDTSNENGKVYAYYYWVFPNLMLNFYDWGLSVNIIEPINKEKTRIKFLSYPKENMKQPQNADSSISKVELEDQEIVLSVQNGMKSCSYNQGRYSAKHESGVHYFHQLLSGFLS